MEFVETLSVHGITHLGVGLGLAGKRIAVYTFVLDTAGVIARTAGGGGDPGRRGGGEGNTQQATHIIIPQEIHKRQCATRNSQETQKQTHGR